MCRSVRTLTLGGILWLPLQRRAASECGVAAPVAQIGRKKAEFAKVAICASLTLMPGAASPGSTEQTKRSAFRKPFAHAAVPSLRLT